MRRGFSRSFVALLLLVVLLNTSNSFACGPFTMEAIFVYSVHPAYPLDRFAGGQIGVVEPTYARSYLYVAYRYLSGSRFSQTEQAQLTELWKDRIGSGWSLGEEDWIKSWLTARQKVPGLAEAPKIEVYRSREKPNEYENYVNCPKDSFDSAITTLNDRIAKYGADSTAVRTWIDGQDQVFANCSEGRHLPADLQAEADAMLRADRVYQTAAANFYSASFDDALKGFQSIAADNNSPWHAIAPYLIARTLVRKASLGPAETKTETLTQAETQLNKILNDKKLSPSHAASKRLLDLVRLRLHPAERRHELALTLESKNENSNLKQNLWDYTILLDGVLDVEDPKQAPAPESLRGDDLTDWISTFQSTKDEAFEHSFSRWQSTKATKWLVASLTKADGKNPGSSELISAALRVQPNSPAFASTHYHAVRLLLEAGKTNEARALIDQLLANNRAQFDESSRNLLVGERMLLANNLAEFLTYAPKVPASLSWNDDGREIPAEDSEVADENKAVKGKPLFDENAAKTINTLMPLTVLKEAAKSDVLPVELHKDLAQAAWLRAILLGDTRTADELVPVLRRLVPDLSSLLTEYSSSTQPDEKRFAGLYAWLKFPGLEPIVDTGIGRTTPLDKQETYRDNWWCSAAFTNEPGQNGDEEKVEEPLRPPLFLSQAELATAAKESASLKALGPAPNYLAKQVIQWVTRNPNDPRAAEALHLAVTTTRYGCTDKETGRWSKAAFDLLHKKYPNTTWARKTPYWFKD
jgi:hypothetical protein